MKTCKWLTVFLWSILFCCQGNQALQAAQELVPPGTTTIPDNAFSSRADLTEVVIPEGVVSIGRSAFQGCKNLESVVMPSTVVSLGEMVFMGCEKLQSVTLSENITEIPESAFGGCTRLKAITLPAKLTRIGKLAFSSCENLSSCIFPATLEVIGKYAFRYCRFAELDLPEGLKEIGEDGFLGCEQLTEVGIPGGLTTLGQGAFFLCKNLKAFRVSEKNTSFSAVDGVLFSKDQKKLYAYPPSKGVAAYTVPDATATYAWGAFCNCAGLVSLHLNHVSDMESDENLMWECNDLQEINVAKENTAFVSIDGVLYSKQMDRLVVYPMGKKAASYAIPAGVISIRQFAFYYNTHLSSVTMPASVASMGRFIFGGCTQMKELHLKSAVPPALQNGLGNEQSLRVYVPRGASSAYRSAPVWRTESISLTEEEAEALAPEVGEASDHAVVISWQPVEGATAYYVKVYKDAAFTTLVAAYDLDAAGQLRSAGLSYQIKELEAGSRYYIEIGAVKQAGDETVVLARSRLEASTGGVPTSIDQVVANGIKLYTGAGTLVIESDTETRVEVYSVSGGLAASRQVCGTETICLPQGIYVVVVGETKYKVAL